MSPTKTGISAKDVLDAISSDFSVQLEQEQTGKPFKMAADVEVFAKQVTSSVLRFLNAQHLVASNEASVDGVAFSGGFSTESFATEVPTMKLASLLEQCGIAMEDREQMSKQVAMQMLKHSTPSVARAFAAHQTKGTAHGSVDWFFSDDVIDGLNMEAFGVDTNQAAAEVAAAIAVPILRYHLAAADKLMPRRMTTNPIAQYIAPRLEVLDLAETNPTPRNILDLYRDPSLIANTLKRIVPLDTNDTTTCVVEDGLLAFGKEANLIALGVVAADPANDRYNHTDTVADSVRFDYIRVSLTAVPAGTSGAAATETFNLSLPSNLGRFMRMAGEATERTLFLRTSFRITNATLQSSGDATTIFAGISSGEAVVIPVIISGRINLKNGIIVMQATVSTPTAGPVVGSAASANLSAVVASLTGVSGAYTATGYSVDARYSEENMRKSHMLVREERSTLEWNIPTGRNVLFDTPLSDTASDDNASGALGALLRLGDDYVSITAASDTIDGVDQSITSVAGGQMTRSELQNRFVAGNRVYPYVISTTYNPADVTRMRDADQEGDIKARWSAFLTGIATELVAESLILNQIPQGQPLVLRVLASPKVIGRLFGSRQIWAHLDNGKFVRESGVVYSMTLPDGTVVEVVSTNFSGYESTVLAVVHAANAPESELNFGHIWDYGSYYMSYTTSVAGNGAWKRLSGNSRFLPTPTCPVAAKIVISNLDSICPLATA